jgi:tetratricopeptide (TPR) repeat protein
LSNEQPARYQPDLARALTNLAGVLGTAGLHREALAAQQEAVTLLRRLPNDQPERQRDLAHALTNLGAAVLQSIGRYEEDARRFDDALAAEQEAVTLLRRLSEKHPAGHQPDLADALVNLGSVLLSVGQHDKDVRRYDDALVATQEAITLLRELADEHPARYQPDLARALRNLGNVLRSALRYDEALDAYQESRVLSDAVASDQPWRSGEVTELDQMVRKFLRDLGREEESVNFAL